jgi:nitroreductase
MILAMGTMPHPKHAATDHDVLNLIRERWSPRAYDATRAIPESELWRLFEAARWTPSSRNEQPWRFIIVDKIAHADVHAALVSALSAGNQAWAPQAPVLIVVAAKMTVGAGDANRHAFYDTGQAVAYLTLQAQSQGLASRQMEGFDRVRTQAICQVPADYDLVALIALGYPGSPDALPNEKHRQGELTPRTRRPAADFVYGGTWGTPA